MSRDPDATTASMNSTQADTALLELVRKGDESAMAQLFARHSRLVFSVAVRVLHDSTAAEDVLQDIFLQIWRDPTSFSATRGSLEGWLAVVARNRSIDILRRRRPTDRIDDLPLLAPQDLSAHAEHNLLLEQIRVVVATLPDDQRRALEMAFFEGCTHSEIAQQTGCPLGTIKTRIRTALQTVGKAFQA